MKMQWIKLLCLIIGLGSFTGCSNHDQVNIPNEEQVNKEYSAALQLLQEFSKAQNQSLSRNGNNKLIIKHVKKNSINCIDETSLSRSNEDVDGNIDIYTFTIEINGKTGFAMVTGDKRIAQILTYVECGAIADTSDIPAMAFMIRNIPASLKYDLKTYYEGEQALSRNNQDWTTISTTPFIKTTWSCVSPYNNNYDMAKCDFTLNNKYQASTAAVACAQAIVANKKRPNGFPAHYVLSEWTREPKIDEKYNIYAPQVAEFIKGLEPGSVTYNCSYPSFAQLGFITSTITYYGYILDQSYSYGITADYAKIARNAQAGYCTIFGGNTELGVMNNYYAWVVDGFMGKLNTDKSQAKMTKVHCVYCYAGKGDGWYVNPFSAAGNQAEMKYKFQFIYFNEF